MLCAQPTTQLPFFPEVTIDLIPNVPNVKETILIWVSRIYIYYVTSSLWDLTENWFHAKLNREVVKLGWEDLSQMASYSLQNALVLTRQIGWHLECSATVHTDLRITTAQSCSSDPEPPICINVYPQFWIPIYTLTTTTLKCQRLAADVFQTGVRTDCKICWDSGVPLPSSESLR